MSEPDQGRLDVKAYGEALRAAVKAVSEREPEGDYATVHAALVEELVARGVTGTRLEDADIFA